MAGLLLPFSYAHAQGVLAVGAPAEAGDAVRSPKISKQVIGGVVVVFVVDGETQLPLAGVRVDISGPDNDTGFTNLDGAYAFPALSEGRYEVVFSLSGYESNAILVDVQAGGIVALAGDVITLFPKSSGGGPFMNLYLTVRDERSRLLIDNPSITLDPEVGIEPVEVESGVFAYLSIPIVEYAITVSKDGYADESFSLRNPNLLVDIEVLMTPNFALVNLDCNGTRRAEWNGRSGLRGDVLVLAMVLGALLLIRRLPGSAHDQS